MLALLSNYKINKINDSNKLKRKYPFISKNEHKSDQRVCYNCNEPGHISRGCPKKKRNVNHSVEVVKGNFNRDKSNNVNNNCSFCHKSGHKIDDCFRRKREQPNTSRLVNFFCIKLDNDFRTKFKINDVFVNCLIDTGAECSLISENIVYQLTCNLTPAFF